MTPKRLVALLAPAFLLTAAPASAHVVLVSPNGGESFVEGEVVTIEWCIAIGHALQSWTLSYNTALPGVNTACGNVTGGFVTIASGIPPTCTNGTGGVCYLGPNPCCMQYQWTVPAGISSDQVKIKVAMINSGTNYYDLSDAPFTISPSTSAPLVADGPAFGLEQNDPNPMGLRTTIGFAVSRDAAVASLRIYDVRGALVRTLVNDARSSGRYDVVWNGLDDAGDAVGDGIYFYRLESDGQAETRKLVVMR